MAPILLRHANSTLVLYLCLVQLQADFCYMAAPEQSD